MPQPKRSRFLTALLWVAAATTGIVLVLFVLQHVQERAALKKSYDTQTQHAP
jgi:heme exporter protein D